MVIKDRHIVRKHGDQLAKQLTHDIHALVSCSHVSLLVAHCHEAGLDSSRTRRAVRHLHITVRHIRHCKEICSVLHQVQHILQPLEAGDIAKLKMMMESQTVDVKQPAEILANVPLHKLTLFHFSSSAI